MFGGNKCQKSSIFKYELKLVYFQQEIKNFFVGLFKFYLAYDEKEKWKMKNIVRISSYKDPLS